MKQKQLNRLFKEFPWLWAIDKSWYHETVNIEVCNATSENFYPKMFLPLSKDEEYWLKWTYNEDVHGIDQVESGGWDCLADEIIYALSSGPNIEYVIHVEEINDKSLLISKITIYRPPKSKRFKDYLFEIKNDIKR